MPSFRKYGSGLSSRSRSNGEMARWKIPNQARYSRPFRICGLSQKGRASAGFDLASHRSRRMFYKFLQIEGAVQDNPAELLASQKMWERVPKVLTNAAINRFLAAPIRSDALWQRDRAILELLYATGCRVSEVANMYLMNVHLEDGYCLARGRGASSEWCRLECEPSKRSSST